LPITKILIPIPEKIASKKGGFYQVFSTVKVKFACPEKGSVSNLFQPSISI
jgi:hypothetical protein